MGGALIVNADDWGRDRSTTRCILDCAVSGAISSVSAMVFMEGSEPAAAIAKESGIDAGLHLNFTIAFTAPNSPTRLQEHQQRVATYLRSHPLARAMFHPGLIQSFEYLVQAQIVEFARLYGTAPRRLDGHHHMHLCANVLFGKLLPSRTIVRRNFSFQPREKSWGNRCYRQVLDRMLKRHHQLVDFFFALAPLQPDGRLDRIYSFASTSVVELETHPVNPAEYDYLARGIIHEKMGPARLACGFTLPK